MGEVGGESDEAEIFVGELEDGRMGTFVGESDEAEVFVGELEDGRMWDHS